MDGTTGFANISVEQARKQAKELVKAHRAADLRALDTIRYTHPRFRGQTPQSVAQSPFALADAQVVIARGHHFESWSKMLAYVEAIKRRDPAVDRFERAADAIVSGELATLRTLIAQHPDLIRQRSTRAHHSTLLHYSAANGVEDYRQLTPPNIVQITTFLLEAGAEVDATSGAYGGSTTLMLTATSMHPRQRGVQIELIDLLLKFGASLEGEDTLSNLVSSALGNGCPEAAVALASRGARVNSLFAAAGLGDLARVRELFPEATQARRERALSVAAQQGHIEVVGYLLANGVDVNANHGMTALHNASAGGHLELMRLLLSRGADLEAVNEYDGTVLSSTIWFAYHLTPEECSARRFPEAIRLLLDEGARTDVYAGLARDIEGVLQSAHRPGLSR